MLCVAVCCWSCLESELCAERPCTLEEEAKMKTRRPQLVLLELSTEEERENLGGLEPRTSVCVQNFGAKLCVQLLKMLARWTANDARLSGS